MAKRLSETQKIVNQYTKHTLQEFSRYCGMMTNDRLNIVLDAFEDECEYDYIYIILDEFKLRKGV